MPIISVRDNGNSRRKRNAKTTTTRKKKTKRTNKDKKERGVREARVKGSEMNDFVVHLS